MLGGIGLFSLRSGAAQAGTPTGTPATIAVERGDVQKTVTAPGQLVGQRDRPDCPGQVLVAVRSMTRLRQDQLPQSIDAA
jgi:hypothetical protein